MTKKEKIQLVIDLLKEYLDDKYTDILSTYNSNANTSIWYEDRKDYHDTIILGNDEIVLNIKSTQIFEILTKEPLKINKIIPLYNDEDFNKTNMGFGSWDYTISFLKEQIGR